MAISRVPGAALLSDLDRQGIDLQFTTSGNSLVYMDFANFRLGINESAPTQALEVNGNVLAANGHVLTSGNLAYDLGSTTNWWNTIFVGNITSLNFIAGSIDGVISTNTQPNITSLGTLIGLDINGNLTVSNKILPTANISGTIGNTSLWWNTVYANTIYSTGIYGNILNGYQPYITTLGNISVESITIGGNITITGNTSGGIINADELYESNNRVLTSASNIIVNGDVVGYGNASNIYVTLTSTGVTPGVYGSADDEFADRIPKITVGSDGRITNISNVTLTQVGNVIFNNTNITSNSSLTITSTDGITIQSANHGNITLNAQGNGIVQISGTDAVHIPTGGTSDRPVGAYAGYIRYNTDLQTIEYYNGSIWVSQGGQMTTQVINPDGVSDVYVLSANATTEGLLVTINGTLQQPTSSYNVVGNVITFSEIPLDSDSIEIRQLGFGVAAVQSLSYDGAFVTLNSGNVNITGHVLPTANVTYDLGNAGLRWRDLYLSGNTINLGGMQLKNEGGVFKAMMGNVVGKLQADDPIDNADVVTLGYLTSQLSSLDSSIITSDDSSISIVDDGVSAGNIVIAVDGSNVATIGNNAITVERNVTVNGNITATNLTGTLVTAAQPNITSVGNLTALTVSGNLIVTNEVLAGNLSGVNVTGLLLTPNQYNVTGLGTLTSGTWSANTIAVNKGGTGATTSADALNNLLPSGEQTGYILKTSGPGTYYWSSESGGGGATVGQQLTTTRQANTATSGQTVFTLVSGLTYTPGTGQLRVYINGVRQFPSEYTETASNVYTLTSGVSAGDIVFAEIDNFSTFNNYANLTYASNVGNISASGLTVQSAIENLENNKAPLVSPVFTGVVTTTGNATIGGALTVSGNLYVNGNVTYINANNISLNDSLIYLADDNPSDSIDIGFVSAFTSNVRYQHTGFVRDATDGVWKLFANVVAEPTTTIDFTNATYANLQVGNIAGTITTASQPNITTIGTLGSLAVTGNITVSGNVKLSSAGWSVRETGTKLYFAYNGVNKMSLDTGGNLVVTGDVTAFGTIT